jgi:hypothetical protein
VNRYKQCSSNTIGAIYCSADIITGAALHAALIGMVGATLQCHKGGYFADLFLCSPRFACNGTRIIAPAVLAQQKKHK